MSWYFYLYDVQEYVGASLPEKTKLVRNQVVEQGIDGGTRILVLDLGEVIPTGNCWRYLNSINKAQMMDSKQKFEIFKKYFDNSSDICYRVSHLRNKPSVSLYFQKDKLIMVY